jgi:hypothetical protein
MRENQSGVNNMPSTGGSGGDISGGQELIQVQQSSASLGRLLGRMITGINQLAKNTSASATGEVPAPKPPDSVSTSVSGEYLHISISHGGQLNRGVRYFSEIGVNDPKFSQPIVIDHGTSRTSHPFPLPTGVANPNFNPAQPVSADNQMVIPTNYFVRSYAQYGASQPSRPTVVGGIASPTAINMGGLTQNADGFVTQFTPTNLLPSTGSGTAPNTGQAAGQGLGKFPTRTGN